MDDRVLLLREVADRLLDQRKKLTGEVFVEAFRQVPQPPLDGAVEGGLAFLQCRVQRRQRAAEDGAVVPLGDEGAEHL